MVIEFVDLGRQGPAPRAPVLRADGLPQRPPARDGRDRAALVLVQQPVRRVPRVHGHRHPARGRPGAARAGRGPDPRRGRDRAVDAGLGRLLPAADDGPGRPARLLDGRAVAGRCPSGPRTALLDGQNYEVHVRYRNRYGRERSYTTGFEGAVPFVQRRHSETESRLEPRALRGLHARGAVPGLPGRPAQARVAGRPARRRVDLGGLRSCRSATAPPSWPTSSSARGRSRSPSGCSRRSTPGWASCSTSGWTTCRWTAPSGTLSGGEAQRIRLATQIGSGLVGVLYVLDEPSIGLHQRDNHRLIETLTRLRDLGNTLIVVEHDEDTIRHRRLGRRHRPGRRRARRPDRALGRRSQGLLDHQESLTGAYLSGREEIAVPLLRRARRREAAGHRGRGARAQPARHRRELPARAASSR